MVQGYIAMPVCVSDYACTLSVGVPVDGCASTSQQHAQHITTYTASRLQLEFVQDLSTVGDPLSKPQKNSY